MWVNQFEDAVREHFTRFVALGLPGRPFSNETRYATFLSTLLVQHCRSLFSYQEFFTVEYPVVTSKSLPFIIIYA
jgi:hypothetical protein